jgi:hypothetical protein
LSRLWTKTRVITVIVSVKCREKNNSKEKKKAVGNLDMRGGRRDKRGILWYIYEPRTRLLRAPDHVLHFLQQAGFPPKAA